METRQLPDNKTLGNFIPIICFEFLSFTLGVLSFLFLEPYGLEVGLAIIFITSVISMVLFWARLRSPACAKCQGPLEKDSMSGYLTCQRCKIIWQQF